jgi:alanyl-tRNA synthetase
MLRFDFSHFQKLSPEEIRTVETLVNQAIRENSPLDEHRDLPVNEAKAMGAMALFGEKYGDKVRVVRFGESIELCGGTHVSRTGNIGSFRIVSESSIAAGIRRIEAVTAAECDRYLFVMQDLLSDLRAIFSNTPNLAQALKKTVDENAELKKAVDEFIREKTIALKKELTQRIKVVNGIRVLAVNGSFPADVIKNIATRLRNEYPENFTFIAGTESDGKPTLTLTISDDLVKSGLNAAVIVRNAARHIQGGGGGQPQFATAGGKNPEGLNDAIAEIEQAVVVSGLV